MIKATFGRVNCGLTDCREENFFPTSQMHIVRFYDGEIQRMATFI